MKSPCTRRPPIPFLPLALLFLTIASLTRLVLTLHAGLDKVPLTLWPGLFLHGLGFDFVALFWILAPMLMWAAIWPVRWRDTRWQGGLRLVIFFVFAVSFIFVALSEWTFWEEFETRFNFIAVDYLVYTHEVIGNIVESYSVPALLTGVVVLALLLTWLFRHPIRHAPAPAPQAGWRVMYAVLALLLPWSTLHLSDIEQMRFSQNTYANELSGNGLIPFPVIKADNCVTNGERGGPWQDWRVAANIWMRQSHKRRMRRR